MIVKPEMNFPHEYPLSYAPNMPAQYKITISDLTIELKIYPMTDKNPVYKRQS